MGQKASWISSTVEQALQHGLPIVVLESTVIAHGLPWPENLETALEMEDAVRREGAMPATVAVVEGKPRIGLSRSEIERMARSSVSSHDPGGPDLPYSKANRRDLSMVVTQGRSAATTVSATLWLARSVGLCPCVMATGGLGGVHRGAARTFDISTDVDELARADGTALVCSGFKSILDLPATLEVLETRGVTIVGLATRELPAFTTQGSGLVLEHSVKNSREAARAVRVHRDLGLPGALVIANPVPSSLAVDRSIMEAALDSALQEAEHRGIAGKELTPFLLDSIRQATAGASLVANRALLLNNARLAGEIACALQSPP
jgi:pseudouridine-5'-phosphate glycosidase